MQNKTSSLAQSDTGRKHRQETTFVYCPRRGRKIAVTFEMVGRLFPHRENVTDCPGMSEGPCDQQCLLPVGGTPFA